MSYLNFVVTALDNLYGGGFIESVSEWITALLEAMSTVIANDFVDAGFTALASIAAALIVLYFLMDMVDNAMRDMFSLEKLCISFVKMIAAVAVCCCAQDITEWIINIGALMCNLIIVTPPDQTLIFNSDLYDNFVDELSDNMSGFLNLKFAASMNALFGHFNWLISVLIITLLNWVLKIAAFFIATSTVIMLCVRVYFAPIGVVSIFGGTHSSGIRYFKSIAAEACSLAGMMVVLWASSALSGALSTTNVDGAFLFSFDDAYTGWVPNGRNVDIPSGVTVTPADKLLYPTEEAVTEALGMVHVIPALIPPIAAIGGMGGVRSLMKEVFGS